MAKLRQKAASIALIFGFFVFWELACLVLGVSDIILPRPSQVFYTLFERWSAIMPHAGQTLYTTLVGFAIGVAIGVFLGALIGSSKIAYDTAYPLLVGSPRRRKLQ